MIISFITGGGGQPGPTPEVVEKSKRIIPSTEMPAPDTVDLGTIMTSASGAQLNVIVGGGEGEGVTLGPGKDVDGVIVPIEDGEDQNNGYRFMFVDFERGRAQGLAPKVTYDVYNSNDELLGQWSIELKYGENGEPDGYLITVLGEEEFMPFDDSTWDEDYEEWSMEKDYEIEGEDWDFYVNASIEPEYPYGNPSWYGIPGYLKYNAADSQYYTEATEPQQWSKLADENYVNNKIGETLGDVEDNLSNI